MSGQNRSSAVMAQRLDHKDPLQFFPTPLWATRAFCEHVLDIRGKTVWEPASGEGHMYRPLTEYAKYVVGSDVIDYYGTGDGIVHDFLQPFLPAAMDGFIPDWVITNPPFRLGQEFVIRGLQIARIGVAVFVRTAFLESRPRYKALYSRQPPSIVAQYVERVPLLKRRVSQTTGTATAYCWLVWYREPPWPHTRLMWIPPSRKMLERPGDYD